MKKLTSGPLIKTMCYESSSCKHQRKLAHTLVNEW